MAAVVPFHFQSFYATPKLDELQLLDGGSRLTIDGVSQAFLDAGDEVVCGWPSFPSYVIDALKLAYVHDRIDTLEAQHRVAINGRTAAACSYDDDVIVDELADLPVLFLATLDEEDLRRRAEEAGASDFLQKPVDSARLLMLARSYLVRQL